MEMEKTTIDVHRSDLEKILDTLTTASEHHVHRDEMNGCLHLAKQVRLSPLTSELLAAKDRVTSLLTEEGGEVDGDGENHQSDFLIRPLREQRDMAANVRRAKTAITIGDTIDAGLVECPKCKENGQEVYRLVNKRGEVEGCARCGDDLYWNLFVQPL